MPWTVKDVDEHKKGLSPAQKKKWVSVANAILKSCLAKGGTDKTCAPKAIRIANSKFEEQSVEEEKMTIAKTEEIKIKKSALCFTDLEASASVNQFKEGEKPILSMVAYSGKIIKGHWYWGDLAIDTDGLKISKTNIPILSDHMTDRKIGFGAFEINEKHQLVNKKATFVDTPFAEEFTKLSSQGFPYEASIYARPTKIQRLLEDEETEVNGFKMKGPGTVWRESVLKECSVVTFGADPNTKSAAMAEDEDVVMEVMSKAAQNNNDVEEEDMDLDKLKAEHPELYAQVVAIGKTEAETAFASEKATLNAQITELSAEKTRLSAANKDTNDRILKLEKQEAIRKTEDIRSAADMVFANKVKATEIPERLHAKIRKQLNHEQFVKDEKLDVEAFSAAIDTELKDWIPNEEGDAGESAILGMSFTKSSGMETGNVDKMVDRMIKSTGQSVQ
ncbi:MAG: hypothetical protein WC346_00240 [Methanogenium sp.]|jgi:hypothetical protein